MSKTDVTKWSDDRLAAEEARLAGLRTEVRLAQNAVSAEIEIRRTISQMSGAGREALILRLSGGVDSSGDAAEKETK